MRKTILNIKHSGMLDFKNIIIAHAVVTKRLQSIHSKEPHVIVHIILQ